MIDKDPIKQMEDAIKIAHDSAGKYTQPVLRRYPLLFSFLTVFGVASILHGFELVAEKIELFNNYPFLLILIGVIILFFTGMLYKSLRRVD